MAGTLGAAVIEEGSRWEAVQRAGRLLKHRAPAPDAAEGMTKYLARDVPSTVVDLMAFDMILCKNYDDIPQVVPWEFTTLVLFHREDMG